MIKFTGKYSDLKKFGFRFHKLYDNRIFYTTYETGTKSDVWIQKEFGGLVHFDGGDLEMSESILKWFVQNDFNIPAEDEIGYNYNIETRQIEKINCILQWGIMEQETNPELALKSIHYIKTHREVTIWKGTFETLKSLWQAGMLSIE